MPLSFGSCDAPRSLSIMSCTLINGPRVLHYTLTPKGDSPCKPVMPTAMKASAVLLNVAAGAIFGIALIASGVHSPSVIRSQMLLLDYHMLKVFLGASACSA